MATTQLSVPIQYARQIANTNSSSLTDSKAIAYATDALYISRKEFAKYGVDAGEIAEVYFTPTAGVGVYNYPDGSNPAIPPMYLLKAIEVNFNNVNQSNYLPAKKLDVSNTPAGYSFDYLRINQSVLNPLYDDHGNWFEIFPTPQSNDNLTNAIKLIYFIQPVAFTAMTNGIGYPESNDPNILGYGIAANYLRSIFKFDEADKLEAKMLQKISTTVQTLGTGGQMPTSPASIPWSGAEF